ncbi:MAG: deoxyhypusine synthase [bacterium]|nr:deoxyhypusine synthase [bacterium]
MNSPELPTLDLKHITTGITAAGLIDTAFHAYNAARLKESCQLFTTHLLREDVTIGLSLSGALTPAGLGTSCLVPLIQRNYVDWIVTTGAVLYHDLHLGLGFSFYRGSPRLDDIELRRRKLIRIYDVIIEFDAMRETDRWLRKVFEDPVFRQSIGSAELHYRLGEKIAESEKHLGLGGKTMLAAAYAAGVPIYVASPGDSSIGLVIAERALVEDTIVFDVSRDVNETAAIVHHAKRKGASAAVSIGGGAPKNFLLQTGPQLEDILGLEAMPHDYFIQFTDARPDTGGLSGATPSEAVSWGKIDPAMLPHAVTAYVDVTIALPLLVAYVLERGLGREAKRLYDRLPVMLKDLQADFVEHEKQIGNLPPDFEPKAL